MRRKRCKNCNELFIPTQPLQFVCSPICAYQYTKTKEGNKFKEKIKRKIRKEEKDKLKTKSEWAKDAQSAFNKYIRARDRELPCISCGRHHQGQYHAGHYRSVGAHPELRFEESNCHKQCAPCNNHKSGNIVEYRINLKDRIGKEKLAWLEGPHEPAKYTIDDLKEIKAKYMKMAKDCLEE